MLMPFYAGERSDRPQRRAIPRLPVVLFESPLMAFALTLVVPLVMMLGD